MSQIRAQLMTAAVTGAFAVGANYILKAIDKKDPKLDKYIDGSMKAGEAFVLGFSGSMLQQLVGPML